MLTSIPPGARFDNEMVIGPYPLAEEQTLAAMPLPTVERLLHGTRLTVPAPEGEPVPGSPAKVEEELAKLFGGALAQGLAPFLSSHRSLASAAQRSQMESGGMAVRWDRPRDAFYGFSAQDGEWQLQGCGDAGVFHCLFFGHELPEKSALGEGGHVASLPLGPVSALIARLAPSVRFGSFRDRTAKHARNVYDARLESGASVILAGVRVSGEGRFFYGIRINLVL